MNARLDPDPGGRSDRPKRGSETRRVDEHIETKIYATALRQTTMDQRHAMAAALAQAETLIEELVERGRYMGTASPDDRESDRLLLALALLRTRRSGFEDGAALNAWWRDSVRGDPGKGPGRKIAGEPDRGPETG
jgi:hypothetical protein